MFRLALLLALLKVVVAGQSVFRSAPQTVANDDNNDVIDDLDWRKKKGYFHIEKGFKCDGGVEMGKGAGKKCEGGMKKEFFAGTKAEEIIADIAAELTQQFTDLIPDDLGRPDDIQALMAFDKEDDQNLERSVEFGGIMKVEWGCKVSMGFSGRRFHKKVECGAKESDAHGKKAKFDEWEDDDEALLVG